MAATLVQKKKCNVCKNDKPLSSFSKRTASKDGLAHTCKSCANEYKKLRFQNNPEYRKSVIDRAAAWNRENDYFAKRYKEDSEYREIVIRRAKQWQKDNSERANETRRRSRKVRLYGITQEHYDAMFAKQKGLCAICNQPQSGISRNGSPIPLVIDHDHKTGQLRALLCTTCNLALGALKDDPQLAVAAAKYLRRWLQ